MEKEPHELNGNGVYSAFSFLFILAFACGVGIFYYYTKSFNYGAIERTLARCEVNARILDSEGLIDLLYVAYNNLFTDIPLFS